MELILLILRLFLAAILALAGVGKLLDPDGGEKVMSEFGVPTSLAKPAATGLSLLEIALAASLLFVTSSWLGALGTLILMLAFIGGMLWQISKGNAPDCHCFGQLHSEPVSKKSVIRNVVFAVPAFVLVATGQGNQGYSLSDPNVNSVQTVFGFLSVAMFAAVLFYLRGISKQQAEIIRRMDLLEVLSKDGGTVERKDAGDPTDSLPIGSLFPDFSLPDQNGKIVSYEHLLALQKPVLFLFVDSSCQPCAALMPDIERWKVEFKDKLEFVFISRGTREANEEKFGSESVILLQKNRELAELVHARWTPSAIFVNSEGKVASHVAVGDESINKLIDDVRTAKLDDPFTHFALKNGHSPPRKIGQTVPEFELKDITGRSLSNRSMLGRQTLVTFWSPTCPHCQAFMEEIRQQIKNGLPEDFDMVILAGADPSEHADIAESIPIAIDENLKVAAKLGVSGTPSGVLIDETGRFASETAIGARHIWSLVRPWSL